MAGQRDLTDFGVDDPDECPHEDTVRFGNGGPIGQRHNPDNSDWKGKIPIYCRDCKDIVDRVEP